MATAAALTGLLQPLLRAVPENRRETFDEALSPQTWTLTEGRPDDAVVLPDAKRLLLSPGIDDAATPASRGRTTLRYRFYPLRSMKPRPAFGDFVAQMRIEADPQAAPFGFALLDAGEWSLKIEYEPAVSRARLVLHEQGKDAETGAWITLPATTGAGDVSLAFVRRGDRIEARIGEARGKPGGLPQNPRVIGLWEGRLAPIVDFALSVRPAVATAAETAPPAAPHPQRIIALTIEPLPAESLYFQTKTRPGSALPHDATRSPGLRNIGGDYMGGYLWPLHSPDARLTILAGNAATHSASGILRVAIAEWQDQPVGDAQHIPLTLAPGEERQMDIDLPAGRYGYFTAHLSLHAPPSADHAASPAAVGAPMGAPRAVAYGITAAPRADEMNNSSQVGTHGAPYALTGAKWVRFWDFGGRAVHWSGIQTSPAQWDWSMLDAAVQRTEEAGLAPPLVVLGMTPEWAATEPERGTYRGKGAYSPPKDIADWSEYCRRVAERYKGRVTHYEIWNEPNNNSLKPRGFFFHGPVESYFELVRAAYAAVKSVDPGAKILAPSGTGHFFPFLERFLELGGGDYCDIISIHTYTTPFPPEIGYHFNSEKSYLHRVETVRRIMKRFGVEKPVWNTEIGYHSGLDLLIAGVPVRQDQIAAEALPGHWPNWKNTWSFRPLDPRRATAFFTRFLLLSSAYGVEKTFIHHRLMQTGAADTSPLMPAPAVGWFSRLLGDATYVRAHVWHDNVQAHEYKLPDGRHVLAFWRVEPEGFHMGVTDPRKTKAADAAIETAPIAGIAGIDDQKPVAAAASSEARPPRSTYFKPARIVPVKIRLGRQPTKTFDLWGNELIPETDAAGAMWPLTEAPVYVLYETPPQPLTAQVIEAIPPPEPTPPSLTTSIGKLVALPEAPVPLPIPTKIEQMLPALRPLPLKQADLYPQTGSRNKLNGGESVGWTLWEDSGAGSARIVLAVRGGGFRYAITVNGQPVPANFWPAWPPRELGRGRGWVELSAILMSEPLTLRKGDKLTVTALQSNSRLYQAWSLPVSDNK
ncbi:glycoside hydrolase family 39 [Opitutaceae bacterium TAV5]|nr:glycoside hydrolase family 39 [Opitutaceae bacterium TAV5]